jgi:hypothetical protein
MQVACIQPRIFRTQSLPALCCYLELSPNVANELEKHCHTEALLSSWPDDIAAQPRPALHRPKREELGLNTLTSIVT